MLRNLLEIPRIDRLARFEAALARGNDPGPTPVLLGSAGNRLGRRSRLGGVPDGRHCLLTITTSGGVSKMQDSSEVAKGDTGGLVWKGFIGPLASELVEVYPRLRDSCMLFGQ